MSKLSLGTLIISVLWMLGSSAFAARLTSTETAYEVEAKHVVALTRGDNAKLVFKPCPNCKELRAPLSAKTLLVAHGEQVSREQFRPLLRKSNGLVYVFISNESGLIRKIELED